MSYLIISLVSFLSGLLGSLGMGAGAVLLLYLRVFSGVEQMKAQGINLLFFLPVAVLSLILHSRKRLVRWRVAGFCILAGLPMVFAGVYLGALLGTGVLSKLFALLLGFIGVKELLYKDKNE